MMPLFEKRFKKVGEGAFSVAQRILPRKRKVAGPLTGKVIKIIRGSKRFESSQRTKALIEKYIELLNKAGIQILQTKIRIFKTRTKHQILLIQPEIPKRFLLNNYLYNCTSKEALDIFKQILHISNNIHKFNSQNSPRIGIDMRLKNFAKTKKGLVLFDLYPPYQKNGHSSIKSSDIIGKRRNIFSIIKDNVLPIRARRRIEKRTEQRLNARKELRRIAQEFIDARPELEEKIEELM